MEDTKVEWTINLIDKLRNAEIGEKSRLDAIKSALENGRPVHESDKNYLKEKFHTFKEKTSTPELQKSKVISKEELKKIETVYLDVLDGFGFESFCQRLFQLSGWGRVEQIGGVADSGRDLIIHTNNGEKIIVECKHQPNSSIGRPIVQKLHSAIISSKTNQGIIVTTGKFSKQAIEYAQNLDNITIRLFDLPKIVELAQKGGMEISQTKDLQVYTFPIRDNSQLRSPLFSTLPSVQSYPTKITDSLEIITEGITLVSVYEAIVDVNESFSTTVGELHTIHVNSKVYYFHGATGEAVEVSSQSFIPTRNTIVLFDKTEVDNSVTVRQFNLERTALTEKIKNRVIDDQTIRVSYYGNNNVRYVKKCVPSKKNIRINDINQILLPRYKLKLKILTKNYSMTIVENKNKLNIPETDFFTCRICDQQITQGRLLLCNSCGNICHPADMRKAHSYLCEICNKTICQSCAYYTRKYLFMKKKLCLQCAEQNSDKLKKLVTP